MFLQVKLQRVNKCAFITFACTASQAIHLHAPIETIAVGHLAENALRPSRCRTSMNHTYLLLPAIRFTKRHGKYIVGVLAITMLPSLLSCLQPATPCSAHLAERL
eukprot:GHRR01030308.1.p2 GENE.GHRR01030308.1~~GHRR01030308.1.p2  ORF type:complete len:105 (-),score=4.51 GHRR01030308.1:197-511(-)